MNPTDTHPPAIEYRDPNDLRPHPLIKPMPRWAKGTSEWDAFVQDIRTRGVTVPIIILKDGAVIDGETRRRGAIAAKREKVPCEVASDNEVAQTILQHLLLRRNLSKGALAYVAYPVVEPAHKEAQARAIQNLRTVDPLSPVRHSVPDGAKRVEDFAVELGISERLFRQAARVREIFDEDPEFRDEMEPRILDTIAPVGLGAVIAGYGGRKATNGKAKRTEEQLELFNEAWSGLGKRFGYWGKMDTDTRERALPAIRKTVAAMPPDLRDELKRAIRAAEKEAVA